MRRVRVYLGGCKGNWREKFIEENPDCLCYDPFRHSPQGALMIFTKADLDAIKDSDVVVFYIAYHIYTGACLEAGYAHALGKPIVLIFTLKGYIDPLLLGVSRKVFTDLDLAIEWFKESTYIKRVRT